MTQLQQQTAIIIGAGREPGRGIAQRFAREGASLWLIDRDAEALAVTQSRIGAAAACCVLQADPANRAQLVAAVGQALQQAQALTGRLDILVNAGLEEQPWARLEDLPDAAFEQAMAQGSYAALWAMKAVLPTLKAQASGSILNVGSVYGENVAEYIGAYNMAGDALKALTRTSAQEWGEFGIRVNMLMATVDDERFRAYAENHHELVGKTLPLVAMQRFGDPVEDVGGGALFLCSDDAQYLTGYVIHADGGYHMAGPVYVPRLDQAG